VLKKVLFKVITFNNSSAISFGSPPHLAPLPPAQPTSLGFQPMPMNFNKAAAPKSIMIINS
jgi:hypothetical protein